MRKLITKALTLIVIFACLSGCWSRKELSELSIVSATGLDWNGKAWEVSLQIIIPSVISSNTQSVGNKPPITVYSVTGDTIQAAMARSNLEASRQLYLAQNQVVIMGEEAMRKGILPSLDSYLRTTYSRETVKIFVTKGKAKDVLSQLMRIEDIPSEGIEQMIRFESKSQSTLPQITVFNVLLNLASEPRNSVIPEILIGGGEKVNTAEALQTTVAHSRLKLGGLAVLQKDKLVGYVDQIEAQGYNFFKDEVYRRDMAFNCQQPGDDQGQNSSFRISDSSTTLRLQQLDGIYTLHVNIDTKGMLTETTCNMDIMDPHVIRQLQEAVGEEIKASVEAAWQAAVRLKTDFLTVSEVFHRTYPTEWKSKKKQWNTFFTDIKMEPRIQVTMERIGLSQKSLKSLIDEE